MEKKQGYGKLCKNMMINEIVNDLKERPNFFITDYMGSSVSDLESVRKGLRPSEASFFVAKNSIMNVVLDQLKLEEVKKLIDGGVGISLSGEDFVSVSKVLVDFAKTHEKFKIKGAVIDGELVGVDKINQMASLPTREVLLATILRGMKSPITGFVGVLGGILRKFIYVVDAVKSNKEKAPQAQ